MCSKRNEADNIKNHKIDLNQVLLNKILQENLGFDKPLLDKILEKKPHLVRTALNGILEKNPNLAASLSKNIEEIKVEREELRINLIYAIEQGSVIATKNLLKLMSNIGTDISKIKDLDGSNICDLAESIYENDETEDDEKSKSMIEIIAAIKKCQQKMIKKPPSTIGDPVVEEKREYGHEYG